ncbi:MAG: sarcosine oxidase subunit delta [Beijerinckiaceae bacterium]
MRITCPYCGERDSREFVTVGEELAPRPHGLEATSEVMYERVYLRTNAAGPQRSHWYHAAGCHAWLVVERDTRDHSILSVEPARVARYNAPRNGVGDE